MLHSSRRLAVGVRPLLKLSTRQFVGTTVTDNTAAMIPVAVDAIKGLTSSVEDARVNVRNMVRHLNTIQSLDREIPVHLLMKVVNQVARYGTVKDMEEIVRFSTEHYSKYARTGNSGISHRQTPLEAICDATVLRAFEHRSEAAALDAWAKVARLGQRRKGLQMSRLVQTVSHNIFRTNLAEELHAVGRMNYWDQTIRSGNFFDLPMSVEEKIGKAQDYPDALRRLDAASVNHYIPRQNSAVQLRKAYPLFEIVAKEAFSDKNDREVKLEDHLMSAMSRILKDDMPKDIPVLSVATDRNGAIVSTDPSMMSDVRPRMSKHMAKGAERPMRRMAAYLSALANNNMRVELVDAVKLMLESMPKDRDVYRMVQEDELSNSVYVKSFNSYEEWARAIVSYSVSAFDPIANVERPLRNQAPITSPLSILSELRYLSAELNKVLNSVGVTPYVSNAVASEYTALHRLLQTRPKYHHRVSTSIDDRFVREMVADYRKSADKAEELNESLEARQEAIHSALRVMMFAHTDKGYKHIKPLLTGTIRKMPIQRKTIALIIRNIYRFKGQADGPTEIREMDVWLENPNYVMPSTKHGDAALLTARIFAAEKEGVSSSVIKNLHDLSKLNEPEFVTTSVLRSALNALKNTASADQVDRTVYTNPRRIAKWVMYIMRKNDEIVNPKWLARVLNIFVAACRVQLLPPEERANFLGPEAALAVDPSNVLRLVSDMESFVQEWSAYINPMEPEVVMHSQHIVSAMQRVYCAAKMSHTAHAHLRRVEKSNVAPRAADNYEPLIQYLGIIRGDLDAMEQVYNDALNIGIKPSNRIADYVISATLRHRGGHEALEKAYEIFYQSGAVPGYRILNMLHYVTKRRRDYHEEKRVAEAMVFFRKKRLEQMEYFTRRRREYRRENKSIPAGDYPKFPNNRIEDFEEASTFFLEDEETEELDAETLLYLEECLEKSDIDR